MFLEKVQVIVRKFWQFKLWVICVPLLSGLLVFLLTRNQERKYISKATLQVNLPTTGDISLSGREFKQYEASLFFYDLIEVIKSRKITEMVRLEVLKKHLEGNYELFSFEENPELQVDTARIYKKISGLRKDFTLLNLQDTLDIAITLLLENNRLSIKELQSQLKAYRVGKSNYVEIAIESENPYKSTFLASCYLDIITEQYQLIAQKKIENNRARLELLVDKAKKELDTKIQTLEKFKIENNIINIPEHTKAIVNQIVNIEVKLAQLKETYAAHARAANMAKENLQKSDKYNFNDVSNRKISMLKDSLRKVNENLLFFTGNEGEKSKLKQQINSLKDEISITIATMVQKVPYDPSQARQELMMRYIGYEIDSEMEGIMIPAVENELKRLNTYAAKFAPLESSIATFSSEIHTAQESYLILLSKLNLVRTIQQGTDDVKITTYAPPTLPREPERSKRAFMIGGAGIASFVIVAAFIIAFVLLDKRVYTGKHFTELTGTSPFITLDEEYKNVHEIKRLRKKIMDLPKELRVIMVAGLTKQDIENSFTQNLMDSLKTFPGKQLFLNATGKDIQIDSFKNITLPEQSSNTLAIKDGDNYQINTDINTSPFELFHPSYWVEFSQKALQQQECIVIAVPPAMDSPDWEEWLSIAQGFVLVCKGGQSMNEKSTALIKAIHAIDKPLKTTLFIDKEQ
ncbi:MAG: hypothetical protein AAGI07_04915 [Bacteroidota bacterium]